MVLLARARNDSTVASLQKHPRSMCSNLGERQIHCEPTHPIITYTHSSFTDIKYCMYFLGHTTDRITIAISRVPTHTRAHTVRQIEGVRGASRRKIREHVEREYPKIQLLFCEAYVGVCEYLSQLTVMLDSKRKTTFCFIMNTLVLFLYGCITVLY